MRHAPNGAHVQQQRDHPKTLSEVRWVLDTNVAVSALAWRGMPYRLLYSSEALLAELAGVLARPHLRKPLAAIDRTPAEVLTDYAASMEIVAPTEIPRVIVNDPDDDHVLACALTARADAIVSGDRHLLALQPQWRDIDILTAAQAVERIEQLRRER